MPLAVWLLGVAPEVPGVHSVPGLESRVQHGETVEPVGQPVHCRHEGSSEDVDLGVEEDIGRGEDVLLPDEGVDEFDESGDGVELQLDGLQDTDIDLRCGQSYLERGS